MLRRFGPPVFITCALAVAALLVALLSGAQGGAPEREAEAENSAESHLISWPSYLLTTNRPHLSVCVDGAAGFDASENERRAVQAALESAIAAAPDVPAEYAERQVVLGCPPATALSIAGSALVQGRRLTRNATDLGGVLIGGPGAPAAPSLHRVFVYYVAPGVYAASFDAEPFFSWTAEVIFRGDVGDGVTTSLYVRTDASVATIRRALLYALGLEASLAPEQERDVQLTSALLIHTDEDERGICVAAAGGYAASEADVLAVSEALDAAFDRASPLPPGYQRRNVTAGCPPPTALTGERLDAYTREFGQQTRCLSTADVPPSNVLAVYFMEADAYDGAFSEAYPYAVSTEERVCAGDYWRAVTGGLYLMPSITTAQLRYAFLDIAGLAPSLADGCRGEPMRPSWIATPEPEWCAEFWRTLGVTPPSRLAATPLPTQQQHVSMLTNSLLFTTNRDDLSVCVQGAGGYSASEADVQAVRQALESALLSYLRSRRSTRSAA